MLTEQTIEKMNAMRLYAMTEAFTEQLASSEYASLTFEERLGLLVDTEFTARENRKLSRRLRAAKMRYGASLEDIDFQTPRRLNRQQLMSLGTCAWLVEHHNLILTGPTGIGKSYLACALVERACRRGFTAYYVRAPRLLDELAVSRVDGSYPRLLARLAKFDLLAIDDWLLAPLRDSERRDLVEVIEDRSERASTLIASQVPVKDWQRRYRRSQSGRDLRPPAPRRPPHRARGAIDAPDQGRTQDDGRLRADFMSTVASLRAVPPGGYHRSPRARQIDPGPSWRLVSDRWPVDPAGGVENASPTPAEQHRTPGRFPHLLGRRCAPPTRLHRPNRLSPVSEKGV